MNEIRMRVRGPGMTGHRVGSRGPYAGLPFSIISLMFRGRFTVYVPCDAEETLLRVSLYCDICLGVSKTPLSLTPRLDLALIEFVLSQTSCATQPKSQPMLNGKRRAKEQGS